MNAVLLHLTLSHFIVALPILSFAFLIVALVKKHLPAYRIGIVLYVIAAVLAVPQYLSGEAAEDAAEHGQIEHQYVEAHEEAATTVLWFLAGSGVIALVGYFAVKNQEQMKKWLILLFLFEIIALVLIGLAAHQGGMIRHPAIRDGNTAIIQGDGGSGESHEHDHEEKHGENGD